MNPLSPHQALAVKRLADYVTQRQLERGIVNGRYRLDEDGELEKRCTTCREYWPADTEFFYSTGGGDRLQCYCKACYYDRRWPNGRPGLVYAPRSDQELAAA